MAFNRLTMRLSQVSLVYLLVPQLLIAFVINKALSYITRDNYWIWIIDYCLVAILIWALITPNKPNPFRAAVIFDVIMIVGEAYLVFKEVGYGIAHMDAPFWIFLWLIHLRLVLVAILMSKLSVLQLNGECSDPLALKVMVFLEQFFKRQTVHSGTMVSMHCAGCKCELIQTELQQ